MAIRAAAVALAGIGLSAAMAAASEPTASLKEGKPDLKSAGPLTFGPEGILFVGDTKGAALFAIDTGDRAQVAEKRPVQVKDLAAKVAGMLGTDSRQIQINDLVVNPRSGNVYLSVARGRGPDAIPVIVRINADGKAEELALENVKFARADIPNAPDPAAQTRGQSLRNDSITDLAYVDGRVFVAGLSNEEFSSRLLAIPYPFVESGDGTSLEIFHGAHGKLETKSPIRTFVPFAIKGEPYLMAAYTCTPLVKIPVADLKPGARIRGTTVAELGNMNKPLDMVVYQKDGKSYILMANSARGVMKIPTEGVDTAEGITEPVKTATKGMPYETIKTLKNVEQLDGLDKNHAVILIRRDGSLNLETIDLP